MSATMKRLTAIVLCFTLLSGLFCGTVVAFADETEPEVVENFEGEVDDETLTRIDIATTLIGKFATFMYDFLKMLHDQYVYFVVKDGYDKFAYFFEDDWGLFYLYDQMSFGGLGA